MIAQAASSLSRVESRSAGSKRCSKRSAQKWLRCRLDVKCLGNVAMLPRRRATRTNCRSRTERISPANTSDKVRGPDEHAPEPDRSSTRPLLHGEDPDRAALRHVRIFAGEDQIHAG